MHLTLRGVFLAQALFLALSFHGTHAYITKDEQEMLDWISQEGGEFKVTISRTSAGVRGVFTTQDVRKGELLIYIPDHLVFSVRNVPAAEGAPLLLKELFTPCSRLTPYLRVLPRETQVLTGYNFPEEYIKFLADDNLELQVRGSFKKHCRSTFEGQNDENMMTTIPEAIGSVNISLPYFEYVVSMLSSRTFSLRRDALSMVPLLDLMNHDIRDINQLDSSRAYRGVRVVAGKDLAKGEEVTITYGNMRSDELLLYYGFLDTITDPPRLLAVDHRNYNPQDGAELPDVPLTGPEEEVRAEILRLKDILSQFESRLQALGPIPNTNPYVADLLQGLHEQRRRAVRHELARLQGLLAAHGGDL
ncbi:hypothetical protein VOLCADRAFT_108207 [Volvox carteri f. nagariensis]|uniref:SET domain-containing protein n=1 Tax=Volvox carteri f. nagariensis TaxID=3068 RepID=D8UIW5_VOLCA|nr:uncharacterized protein VOLCADRAFT_108207 [Volvox carteri f. nagariensis]EFJ40346.1 hypothetical protein VOLCADRAFT_108207 [Volvox carteri f. nagariensis]|eukprot:XP_002958609.1 hypothetical protein VOLCADRAFT_108207 [Volvox carteri f. nagariensis]